MNFFVGLHQPSDCQHFVRSFVSVNRLRERQSDFVVGDWIMDSGAFTEISQFGTYRHDTSEYVRQINRWGACGNMLAAVSQDWMCEPFIVRKTGLSVKEHQLRTFHRWQAIIASTPHYVMPVLQGFQIDDYLAHLQQYGGMLKESAWVGVGSVCKRNSDVRQIEEILLAITDRRPDLRLHGFGLKTTALESDRVWKLLYSADSMAWSDAARKQSHEMRLALEKELGISITPKQARAIYRERGIHMKNANDWREARDFENRILTQKRHAKPIQLSLSSI